ncbi:tetratricopeptide repeat protein [Sphingopyxis sp.]|uniref:tetratricopeptide repeat protein n=1 Tax=Sphingopyxis sp. TaxID=1908224 RepID=UPI003F72D221
MTAAVLTALAAPAHAKWLRADTESFIIYSESNEKQLREFAANLQRFDTTLRLVFNVAAKGEESRLPIYLLPSGDDVARLATGSRSAPISGFYRQDRDGSFALSHRQSGGTTPGTSAAQQVLFHEYSHHFMKRHLRVAFPGWFIEGFAEYYSTVDFDKEGRAMIGQPAYRRAYGLLMLPKMPADRVLLEPPSAMRSRGQTDVYYGRSWLLTHMLFHDPARTNQINTYTNAINAGTEPRKAATDAFGDLAQLDKDLNRYVEARLSYRTTRDAVPVSTAIRITPLSADEDAVVMLRLERLNARSDKARLLKVRDALRALAAKMPANSDVHYELAAAEWDIDPATRDLAAMRSALDKALAARPEHVRANVLLGQLQLSELRKKGETDPAAWREARRPIQIANRADPNDPIPLHAYFQSFLTEGKRPSDMAIKGLERAFALTPENLNLRSAYAVSLAHLGRFEPAINLAKTVAFDPHDNGRGDALLKRIETMRDRGVTGTPEAPGDDDDGG